MLLRHRQQEVPELAGSSAVHGTDDLDCDAVVAAGHRTGEEALSGSELTIHALPLPAPGGECGPTASDDNGGRHQ